MMVHVLLGRAHPTAGTLPFRLGSLLRFTQPAGSGDNGGPHSPRQPRAVLAHAPERRRRFFLLVARRRHHMAGVFAVSVTGHWRTTAARLPRWHWAGRQAGRDSGEHAAVCAATGKYLKAGEVAFYFLEMMPALMDGICDSRRRTTCTMELFGSG